MTDKKTVAVLGGGSFGTAVAKVIAENGFAVKLWMRDADQAEQIRQTRINQRYFPGVELPASIETTTDLNGSVAGADVVFLAVPSKAFLPVVREALTAFHDRQIVVSTTKGIERDGFRLMSEILMQELPRTRIGVLSGPNLAGEMVKRDLTATVIASRDPEVRRTVQELMGCDYFRVYANTDMYGVELGGALKNIYAIVAGMASSLGMGENTKAMLITRGLAEMSRFAVSMGANPMTFLGLAGVGDLIVTCTSPMSRNFRVGVAVGQGTPVDEATADLGQVAEGVYTLKLVKEKAVELGIYMPMVSGLYEIIYNKASIRSVISSMMAAAQSTDVEFILPRSAGGQS